MLEIKYVEPGSIGEELEIEAGDQLLSINGESMADLLDYELHSQDEEMLLEVRKKNGELWDIELEKDAEDTLGLLFEPPEPNECGNNCIFCFVHQLPRGMRSTLYVKDEDYRFSYLYGTYVTLTNITEADLERIISRRLSPLYVSVHATDVDLRNRMLGRESLPILDILRRLTSAGIRIHTQIVACPGINDGAVLERTVRDLHDLQPGIESLAVVPVGLTGYRSRLPQLRPFTREEAVSTLELLASLQQEYLAATGTRFVFAADELYIQADLPFPALETYEDLAQLENGVGMVPLFRKEAVEALQAAVPLGTCSLSVITGESAAPEVRRFAGELTERTGVAIAVHPIPNTFFGGHVSVTGLVTGGDIIEKLRDLPLGEALLVPDVMLKEGEEIFLDDLSLVDLERELKVPVYPIPSTPWGLLQGVEQLCEK